MREVLKFSFCFVIFLFIYVLFPVEKTNAASLASFSDTISTSRPSASTPITANQAASATQVTVVDNGSMFLASDSATFRPDTGETIDIGKNVASMSAQITGTPNTRIVYFTNTITNTHHAGDPVVVPITAMHTVKFTTIASVPTLGTITLTFPALTSGDANNSASPSATTFQLNNLTGAAGTTATNIVINGLSGAATFGVTTTNPSAGVSPTLTLALTGTTFIPANTVITIILGCSAQSSGACTTSVPTIINPTQNSVTAGTARSWRVSVTTRDVTNNTDLDTGKTMIGTVDAVTVSASVDPSLSVIIAGLLSSDNNLSIGGGTCGSESSVSGGANATATTVDLGALGLNINRSAQKITVSTNSPFGYTITATSSGRLINAATGHWITDANGGNGLTANDTPVSAAITGGTPGFGISPCGSRVSTASPNNWGPSTNTIGATGTTTALFSNPWNSGVNSYYATIASYTGSGIASDITVIRYAATVSSTTIAGNYATKFTYVVAPSF